MKIGDLVRDTATNDRMTGVIIKLGEMIRGRYSYPWAKVVWSAGAGGHRDGLIHHRGHRDEVLIKDLEVISESR